MTEIPETMVKPGAAVMQSFTEGPLQVPQEGWQSAHSPRVRWAKVPGSQELFEAQEPDFLFLSQPLLHFLTHFFLKRKPPLLHLLHSPF